MQLSVMNAAYSSVCSGRPGGPQRTEEVIDEDLRPALLVAIQGLREVEKGRDENFGFGGGHARSF